MQSQEHQKQNENQHQHPEKRIFVPAVSRFFLFFLQIAFQKSCQIVGIGRVILEIDPPEDDISIRRRHFYERLGFVANPYQYIHPSFRKPFTPHRLVLMSYPGAITYEEARNFADFVREVVLRYSEHEAPALPKLP